MNHEYEDADDGTSAWADTYENDDAEGAFIAFLADVEHHVAAVTDDEHTARLREILQAGGLDLDVPGEQPDQDLISLLGEGPADPDEFRLAMLRAELLETRALVDKVSEELRRKTSERAQVIRSLRHIRQRSDELWTESVATRKEASEVLAQAKVRAQGYQDAAIEKAKRELATAQREADELRHAAAEFADALVAGAAATYAVDNAADCTRVAFHAAADRHERLLAGASSEGVVRGGEERPPAGLLNPPDPENLLEPSDELESGIRELSDSVQGKMLWVIAFDEGRLRLVSPHRSRSARQDAWRGAVVEQSRTSDDPPVRERRIPGLPGQERRPASPASPVPNRIRTPPRPVAPPGPHAAPHPWTRLREPGVVLATLMAGASVLLLTLIAAIGTGFTSVLAVVVAGAVCCSVGRVPGLVSRAQVQRLQRRHRISIAPYHADLSR